MELNHDWRSFSAIFQPRPCPGGKGSKPAASSPGLLSGPIRVVTDGSVILAALGVEGDSSDWIGRPLEELSSAFPDRDLAIVDRREADAKLSASLSLSHFYDQTLFLRENIEVTGSSKKARGRGKFRLGREPVSAPPASSGSGHFLLAAIHGWWAKVLPSAYGLYIRLEPGSGVSEIEAFFLIRRGRLELFHSPDLSILGVDRARQPSSVVKYLSEKHGVPVQGLVTSARDWAEWSSFGAPSCQLPGDFKEAWRRLAIAIQANEAQLVPFRWQIMSLIATRAFLGI